MELTERLLNDAGGWQVMKQARVLHEMGRVSGAIWQPPMLQGRVREGESEYRSGLRILSRTNIENLCGCRASRQRGMICAHSVAVGLEVLKPSKAAAPPAAPAAPQASPAKKGEEQAKPSLAATLKPKFSVEEGTPVELTVILPPNLAPQWQKGGVTVGVEAIFAGKRVMVSALDRFRDYRCDAADLRLVEKLRELTDGQLPGAGLFPKDAFLALLTALAGHPRVTFGRTNPVVIEARSLKPALSVEPMSTGAIRLKTSVPQDVTLLPGSQQLWALRGNKLQPVGAELPPAYRDLLSREIVIPAEHAPGFLGRELGTLGAYFELPKLDELPQAESQPAPAKQRVAFALTLEGSLNYLTAKLEAHYGVHTITLPTSTRTTFPRDFEAERNAVEKLQRAGFTGPDAQGLLALKTEQRILTFFARELPQWEQEAEVTIGSRFQHVTRDVERIQPHMEVRSSGENWFDLQFELTTDSGERIPTTEIQRLLQAGQSHFRRKNGKIAVFDPGMVEEFQQVLQECNPQQKQPGLYRVDSRHAGYLSTVANERGTAIGGSSDWQSWVAGTRELERLEPVPLGNLDETLRPYQKQGVYWMNFLAKNRLAGILADEMGLGKTVQTLALLRVLGGKALIVCPSSLVYNWQREAARFTPDRRCLAIVGADRRALFGKPLAEADLVVTSYALLRRDLELYRGTEFQAAVLDEAQHIKNPDTQNAQAAYAIRARNRFALTGTPIENSLRDLWSLMQFLMPGYLGSREDFKTRYEKPVTDDPSGPEQKRLLKRLRPFVLRRTKRLVATELPEKIVQVSYCELTDAQKKIYTELLGAARRQVSELAGSKDLGKRRIAVLTALLRLRQACCDLRLLGGAVAEGNDTSAKLDLLHEIVGEAIDGGHRVLVFSQFVSMLKLARESLTEAGIETCYLDGSTRDRAAVVDEFQNGNAPVFLISLKAGGTGLNLTAADTVVHFDPWWNPAVEDQATDRAHRIGQKSVVTAYKLVARDTVEEKILALQTRKRQLSDLNVESEQPLMEGLEMSELEELLA